MSPRASLDAEAKREKSLPWNLEPWLSSPKPILSELPQLFSSMGNINTSHVFNGTVNTVLTILPTIV
jgi:hypothetical protein